MSRWKVESVPWLVLDSGTGKVFCQRCGRLQPFSELLPAELDTMTALMDGYSRQHADCEEPAGGPLSPPRKAVDPRGTIKERVRQWLDSGDCGISSKVIASTLSGENHLSHWPPYPPADPSDFGRCHRLLELIPEWREQLPKVAIKHPAWAALVREWAELTRLFLEESPGDTCPQLYRRMQELNKQGEQR